MEHPWRPRQATANFCPICSNSHFPFCPPPPPQYFRPPRLPDQFLHSAPPPPPPPPYGPFVDHPSRPSVNPYLPPLHAQIPPRPWNNNPNFGKDHYGSLNPGPGYDANGQIGVKRMRFDSLNESFVGSVEDDERRLKLIREHGAASHGVRSNDGGSYMFSNAFRPISFGDNGPDYGDRFLGFDNGYVQENNSHMKRKFGDQFAFQQSENNLNLEFARSVNNPIPINLVQNHSHVDSVNGADIYEHFERPLGDQQILGNGKAPSHERGRNFSTQNAEFNNQLKSHEAEYPVMQPKSGYYGLPNPRGRQGCQGFKGQPPLPNSPPPPLPVEPPGSRFSEPGVFFSSSGTSSLFPVAVDAASSIRSPYTRVSEAISSTLSHYSSKRSSPISNGHYPQEIQAVKLASTKTLRQESGEFPLQHLQSDRPKVIDASHILRHPHRASRPDHIVIILRGLPGSGKSYLAKILRDLEVENGGCAPRIHSMDEYFMTEVEKVEEGEASRLSGSTRGRKPVMKKVMEYCYEPDMEEAYRSSMLKAFKKTLDEGAFPLVIVDDRNLRVADFAQFWATAKRSGYEVYLLEATYRDPAGCAARNVHGFTQNDIHKMADQWEEAPSLYMKLDIQSLLHGDYLEENGILEVDMDTEDGNGIGCPSSSEDTNVEKTTRSSDGDIASDGPLLDEQKGDAAEERPVEVVKELGRSKWSNDLDDDDCHDTEAVGESSTALSGLIKSYSKQGKSVRWADQVGRVGFLIGAGKTANVSLVIGPGSGYNLKSNPLPEEEKLTQRTGEVRSQNVFQEQLRAERESFRAVFDKRRQRITGVDADEE